MIMAGSSTSATLGSSDDTCNGTKLMRLILDFGTEALRIVFRNNHSGNLQVVLSCTCSSSTCTSSTCNHNILLKLKGRGIIKKKQWNKLYPSPTNAPNINDFDITLLSVLLRNICGLKPPRSGWDNTPNSSDHSELADSIRIKLFRNERFGHIAKTAVSMANFKAYWEEISLPLVRLGIDQKEIDKLENEECGKEEVERLRKEWNECDNKIMNAVEENTHAWKEHTNAVIEIKNDLKVLVQKEKENQSDGVLNKHLVWCDFQKEIELYNAMFTIGTRQWVFDHVLTWFNDKTSKNRAFVICGRAGMGKSVIAAVICKKFAEHVGAFHFFQYNNSKYSNPNYFLQSLAWHLCKVVPPYKEALIKKFCGNLGKSLNDMDIEGLFSTLFKEPFSGISDPGKHILIVIDAVDESEYNGRHELAKLISNHLHKLPSYLRFLITTRSENKLLSTFKKLKPLVIEVNDERNLKDIKLVLQDKIPSSNYPTADFINILAQKCNGLMLYAFCLTEMAQSNVSIQDIDSLPEAVEECYENYFQRLEGELEGERLNIPKDKFLDFLSALAVANEPLPEAFVGTLFGFENPADAKRKVAETTNVLSLLLVIRKDKSISFFHKSVSDWLVDKSLHDYSVNVQYGHKILFDLCVKKLDDLKRNGVSKEGIARTDIKYALKHWVSHMLKGLEVAGKLEEFVGGYLIDLEVMFASVFVNVDVALSSVTILKNHEKFEHVSADTKAMVRELYFLIRKYVFSLGQYPQTFLQNIVNEGGKQLSAEASNLLKKRYKGIFYFQADKQYRPNNACEARCHLSDDILSIDVTREGDYVVVGYREGGIELFSLTTGMSQWTRQDFILKWPPPYNDENDPDVCMLPHNIVFHPRKRLILPGKLDKVLTFQGTPTTEPFRCDESSSVFSNCRFSMDGSKMVTNYRNDLFVWNVSNGSRERCLQCSTLYSLSFSASGDFLGTTDSDNVFRVYDVRNDYNVKRIDVDSEIPVEIFSTFDHNSWLCSVDRELSIMSHDLVRSSDFGSIEDIALPSNVHSSREFQFFAQHPEQSWLLRIRKDVESWSEWCNYTAVRYILVGDKNVLFFSRDSNIMRLSSIEGLAQTEQLLSNVPEYIFSSISWNGDFVYLCNHSTKNLTVCKLGSQDKYSRSLKKSDFLVVKDGVIFYCKGCECSNPELWNSDVTKCLSSFDQLAGTKECLSVSDEVIACVFYQTRDAPKFRIIFFNVSTKQKENEMSFGENSEPIFCRCVEACSINYHVLTYRGNGRILLWKDGKKLDGWTKLFYQGSAVDLWSAAFSPNGNNLAISYTESNKIRIFDVASTSFLAQIASGGPDLDFPLLKFFDNENLLYGSENNMLYSINLYRREIVTCLDMGDKPIPISVCREQNIVCVGLNKSKDFVLVKVCLPRRLKTS